VSILSERKALMEARDRAVIGRNFNEMNRLTQELAKLPVPRAKTLRAKAITVTPLSSASRFEFFIDINDSQGKRTIVCDVNSQMRMYMTLLVAPRSLGHEVKENRNRTRAEVIDHRGIIIAIYERRTRAL